MPRAQCTAFTLGQLARGDKMMDPRYRGIVSAEIPSTRHGNTVKVSPARWEA